jgi:hypothetical protein
MEHGCIRITVDETVINLDGRRDPLVEYDLEGPGYLALMIGHNKSDFIFTIIYTD